MSLRADSSLASDLVVVVVRRGRLHCGEGEFGGSGVRAAHRPALAEEAFPQGPMPDRGAPRLLADAHWYAWEDARFRNRYDTK